jgi:ATP-dependent DNA helicase PIF1
MRKGTSFLKKHDSIKRIDIDDIPLKKLVNKVIYNLEHGNVLLSGSGGTGKSYLLKAVATQLLKEGYTTYLTATTGVAALSLSDKSRNLYGSTIHSWSGVGLGIGKAEKLYENIATYKKKAEKKWKKVDILIIDEVSMLGGYLFTKLDFIAKKIRQCNLPFGGIRVLLCGDFLQLPPIQDIWIFTSKSWKELELYPIILREPKRFDDLVYFDILSRFRYGIVNNEDKEFLMQCHARYVEYKKKKTSLQVEPTYLFPLKKTVETYNLKKLVKLPTPSFNFKAIDNSIVKRGSNPKEVENRIKQYEAYANEFLPPDLTLKVGAQVMLKVNLDVKRGLVNGSRGVVVDLSMETATVMWKDETKTVLMRYAWKHCDKWVEYTRNQIPLILAWSHSIHKSQGITLDFAVCNIGSEIFADAQAYVALSRVRNRESLLIGNLDTAAIKADRKALEYTQEIEEEYSIRDRVTINLIGSDKKLWKIISSGQTGVDRGGLEAAKELKLQTGGTAPPNFMTSTGKDPTLGSIFGLTTLEKGKLEFVERSKKNVDDADATITFLLYPSVGIDKIINYCKTGEYEITNPLLTSTVSYRPILVITSLEHEQDNIKIIKEFMKQHNIGILNISGHREPELEMKVKSLLVKSFS